MPNVVFDEDSAARIAKAVKYVEGLQSPEEGGEEEVVEQEGRKVIRGTFTGEWAKNTDKTVAFTADNGDAGTKMATNYFTDVGGSGSNDCVIMLAGSEWVLVSAEPAIDPVIDVVLFSTSLRFYRKSGGFISIDTVSCE